MPATAATVGAATIEAGMGTILSNIQMFFGKVIGNCAKASIAKLIKK